MRRRNCVRVRERDGHCQVERPAPGSAARRVARPQAAWSGSANRKRLLARRTIPELGALVARCIAEREPCGRPADVDAAIRSEELHGVAAFELVGLADPAEIHRPVRHRCQDLREPIVGRDPLCNVRRRRTGERGPASRPSAPAAACPPRPGPRVYPSSTSRAIAATPDEQRASRRLRNGVIRSSASGRAPGSRPRPSRRSQRPENRRGGSAGSGAPR